MQKPNVLLIVLDTLRRDRLTAYGHHRDTSPELADFAARARGERFDATWPTPWAARQAQP